MKRGHHAENYSLGVDLDIKSVCCGRTRELHLFLIGGIQKGVNQEGITAWKLQEGRMYALFTPMQCQKPEKSQNFLLVQKSDV